MSLQLAPWAIPVAKVTAGEKAEIERLLAQGDRNDLRIRKAFIAAVERLGDNVDTGEIIRLLRAGQVEAAIAVVEAAALLAGYEGVSIAVTRAVLASGESIAARITVPGAVEFQFSATNPATVTYLQQNEFSLIRELGAQSRESVAISIREGVKDGRGPLDVARDVRSNIGLTARQTQAVINYRRLLETRHLDALERKLRDKRFDGTVRQAIRDQKPIPKAKIDKMVERYRAKYLKYRSETIGRTEGLRAANAGAHLAWVQAVNDGKVRLDQIVRKWVTSEDHLVRDAHRAIPKLNADGVGLVEPFRSPLGPIMMPGDPNADPANTINCRCTTIIRYRMRPTAPKPPEPEPEPPKPTLAERNAAAGAEAEKVIRDLGAKTGVEHLRWVDLAKGEIVEDTASGDVGFVAFTPAFNAARMDPKRDLEAHHNHPSSLSFSTADIAAIEESPGLSRVYAHGHNGSRYMVEDAKPGAVAKMNASIVHLLRDPTARAAFDRLASSAGRTRDFITSHAQMIALQDAGLVKYEADLAPRWKTALALHGAEFDAILARMKAIAAPDFKKADRALTPGFIDPPYGGTVEEWQRHLDALLVAARTIKGFEPAIAEARRAVKAGGLSAAE